MNVRFLLTTFALLFSTLVFAGKTKSYEILDVKTTELGGTRLQEAKDSGLSGKAYQVNFNGAFSVVEKEDLDVLVRFRGLEITEDLIGMKVGGNVEDADEALNLEILNARKKGHYTAPTQEEFTAQLAKGFLTSDNHCPRVKNFSDSKTALNYGSKIIDSKKGKEDFEALMTQKLQAIDKSAQLVALNSCPKPLKARTMQKCYEVRSNGKAVTTFNIGAFDYAGVACVVAPGLAAQSKANKGYSDKNEP